MKALVWNRSSCYHHACAQTIHTYRATTGRRTREGEWNGQGMKEEEGERRGGREEEGEDEKRESTRKSDGKEIEREKEKR